MLKIKYFTGCLALAVAFFSCKKSDSFDVVGDPTTKFFVDNNPTFANMPDNSISYAAVNIPNVAGSGVVNLSTTVPAAIKFPVYASRAISMDVTINAELDTTLVAAYNASHNTKYAVFPAGILTTTGLVAHMSKGSSTSSDSITVPVDATKLGLLTLTAYMAPIKLTSLSAAAGEITTNTRIAYIVINVEQRRIKYLATTADVIGAILPTRTAWTSAFDPALTTTGSIFDGSTTTYSRWSASPGTLDVNMQTVQNITGIRLYTATSATYVPTQVDVYLSTDGITYDLIGSPLKANLTYASSYNYILFYKAIPAKYVRLKLYYATSTNTQNYRVVEFDAYAN
ncbi:BT_3987 domain-containing protein [Ferruginibacter sp.]